MSRLIEIEEIMTRSNHVSATEGQCVIASVIIHSELEKPTIEFGSSMLKQAYLQGGSDKKKAQEVVRNLMNEEIGVTKNQHEAMLHGSHFGFDNPAVYKILKGEI